MNISDLKKTSEKILCALHKVGVNIEAPENVKLLNMVFDIISKNGGVSEYLITSGQKYNFLSLKNTMSGDKDKVFDRKNLKFNSAFEYYFNELDNQNMRFRYIGSISALQAQSAYLIYDFLSKKYDLDIKEINEVYPSIFDLYQAMFYQFEKVGKFKSKVSSFTIGLDVFNPKMFEGIKKICDVDISVGIFDVTVKVTLKDHIMNHINSATKISKHIKSSRNLKIVLNSFPKFK